MMDRDRSAFGPAYTPDRDLYSLPRTNNISIEPMKKLIYMIVAVACCLASCSEKHDVYDPYENWAARNAAWFEDTVQVARLAIAQARAVHGDRWQEHCPWRMFKSVYKTASSTGPVTDSICVRIINAGTDPDGKGSPAGNDSVRVNFRGWLMPTLNYNGNGSEMSLVQDVFTTTYYGDYDPETASPQLMPLNGLVEGFTTALQYMVEGDDWMVFIPQNLAYGKSSQGSVKAYSTLQYRIHLIRWYESGTGIGRD